MHKHHIAWLVTVAVFLLLAGGAVMSPSSAYAEDSAAASSDPSQASSAEASPANSSSDPQTQNSKTGLKTVRLGYYEARNFTEGATEGAIKSGYGYEYLQRVAAYAGWKFEYVYGTWDDLYQKLADGQIDLLPGVSKTEAHEAQVDFPSLSMLNETFYIYAGVDDDSVVRGDVSTFAGKRVGIVAGGNSFTAFDDWLDTVGIDMDVVPFDSYNALHEAFASGQIDVFVSSDNVAYKNTDAAPFEIVGSEPYYLATAQGEDVLLGELNQALSVVNSQDRVFLDELQNRYAADSVVNVYLSSDEAAWISEHQTLKVGYLDDYLPYSATDDAGNATGLMTDVLSALLDGLPGEWHPNVVYKGYASQAGLLDAVLSGKVDVAFPVGGETWYAEKIGVSCSTAVVTPSMDAVTKQDASFADATKVIAINRNNWMQRLFVKDVFPEA